MNRDDFINAPVVQRFIQWLEARMDKPGLFVHRYYDKKRKCNWECVSLYSAYRRYIWSGGDFTENMLVLGDLSRRLKEAVCTDNADMCMKCCASILDWGGIKNLKISDSGMGICNYLKWVEEKFESNEMIDQCDADKMRMTSGFSKIYSLYIEDFIIYDSRVGAALGLLVRYFCQDEGLKQIPCELEFGWSEGKGCAGRRNPSNEHYIFPRLYYSNPKRYIYNNMRANWLLKEIAGTTNSRFKEIDASIRMRALEAALFMIGYDVRSEGVS